MSSAENEIGRSIASNVSTWRRSGKISIYGSIDNPRRRTVLHDVTDDAELIKVASTPFSTERLLEGNLEQLELVHHAERNTYLNIIDVVAVPGRVEESVAEAHNENVLDHLLT